MDRDVTRKGIVLQPFEHGQTGTVRQTNVEQHGRRTHVFHECESRARTRGVQEIEVELVREVTQDFGERDIVLDCENRATAARAIVTVVGNRAGRLRCAAFLFAHIAGRRDGCCNPLGSNRRHVLCTLPCGFSRIQRPAH